MLRPGPPDVSHTESRARQRGDHADLAVEGARDRHVRHQPRCVDRRGRDLSLGANRWPSAVPPVETFRFRAALILRTVSPAINLLVYGLLRKDQTLVNYSKQN